MWSPLPGNTGAAGLPLAAAPGQLKSGGAGDEREKIREVL